MPLSALPRALRVSQWVKNLLVFVPIVLDHRLLEPPLFTAAVIAFVVFSLAGSAAYVLVPLMAGAVVLAAVVLPPQFLGLLLLYLVVTTAYSTWLKRLAVLDVLVLAGCTPCACWPAAPPPGSHPRPGCSPSRCSCS